MSDPRDERATSHASMQYAVSCDLLGAENLADAAPAVLRTIAMRLGMQAGAFWWVGADDGMLHCAASWRAPDLAGAGLDVVNGDTAFAPGAGLPGRALESGEPVWVRDILHDGNFPRLEAARAAGLHTGFAFPARGPSGVLGVFEFFRREELPPDQSLLDAVATLGNQVGRFLEHERARQAVRTHAAHLRATLDTSLDAIVSMDQDGFVIEWNRAAESLFGYAREEAMGRDMATLIIPRRYRGMHYAGLKRYLETGVPSAMEERMEVAALRRDGSEFPVELTITRIPLDGPPTFTGYIRDISDRQRADREREQLLAQERAARDEAERASRIKDEFLALLSHELRTPLNAILGWTHLLRVGSLPPERAAHGIEVIERNSRLQARLIEDLLDMSRILFGKIRLEVRTVAPAAVVAAAMESVAPSAQAKRIMVERHVAASVPEVQGDPGRLQQVIWNLLANAIKFTPEHGHVKVSITAVDSRVEIAVSDTGQGVAREFLPFIFERFRQADSSISRTHGGLGLGLSIVKQIVEMHGGTARAESPGIGEGTTVTISLPTAPIVLAAFDDSAPRTRPIEARAAPAPPTLNGLRLLVVDDDADARDIIQSVLEAGMAEVRTVTSAAEAMDTLPVFRPHVLISDIGMPGEDGYALIRQVRTLPPTQGGATPAVALTALARPQDRDRATKEGFQAHIAKPADPVELLGAVALLAKTEIERERNDPDVV